MLPIFDGVRDVTVLSTTLRMLLAVVCGGLIGLEREYKRRPAGFRTHILICLGAAMTTLTSQFLYLNLHYYTDMARLGAQVVAGIGFIGAGAIIVTRRRRVKGLTTAAGLWAAAIVGLCLGGGFYEGGIFATALILAAEMFLSKLEYRMLDNAPGPAAGQGGHPVLPRHLPLWGRGRGVPGFEPEGAEHGDYPLYGDGDAQCLRPLYPAAEQAVPGGAADPQDERHGGRGVGRGVVTAAQAGRIGERL